uniref:Uncharacterized protein n=1 Tax=Tanacetum cinerariifolium TaxID=118510 RepID=A0A6L2KCG9_TANCI|nr:hypothetical protein [Tanacetum cinerariifolium]
MRFKGIARVDKTWFLGFDFILDFREGGEEGFPPKSYNVVCKVGPCVVKVLGSWQKCPLNSYKFIANQVLCVYKIGASEEDNDLEQAQRDKDMQKNLALIAKYFKRIYKPTNNNLGTSSNSRNKNVDTTP